MAIIVISASFLATELLSEHGSSHRRRVERLGEDEGPWGGGYLHSKFDAMDMRVASKLGDY